MTLSRHFSPSFIASGRSSGLHPASSHSCCTYVLAGHPALARPYVGVRRSTSLMSWSLLLQKSPACLAPLTWIVFVMGAWWRYSWCFVGCCRQDFFNIARKEYIYIYITSTCHSRLFFYWYRAWKRLIDTSAVLSSGNSELDPPFSFWIEFVMDRIHAV